MQSELSLEAVNGMGGLVSSGLTILNQHRESMTLSRPGDWIWHVHCMVRCEAQAGLLYKI